MNLFKTARISALAFAYLMTGISPAMADDSEIYFGGVTGGTSGGSPNVLLLLDTSGSMLFPMYDKYPAGHPSAGSTVPTANCADGIGQTLGGCAKSEDDRRSRHLANAVKRILENLDGNIRVGIGRYNSNSAGGRIIYGARGLDERTSTGTTESRTYLVASSIADAHQVGSAGTAIVTDGSPLPLGDAASGSYNALPTSFQVQSGTSSTTSTATTLPLGGYSTSALSNIGVKFTGLNIPQGVTIASASIVLTHCGTTCTFTGGPAAADNGAFNISLAFENSAAPGDYGTSGTSATGRVTSSGRAYQTATTVAVAATELLSTNTTKTIDVKTQVQAFVSATGWTSTSYLALKLAGVTNYATATKNGRLIGRPTLVITYNANSAATYTGLRYTSIDIPRGATINSAFLDFTAAQSDSGTASWEIKTDPAAIAEAFPSSTSSTAVNHLDGTRWNGGATTTWSPGNWTSGSVYSADVKSLLQANVNLTSYCGGSAAIAFRIRQTGTFSASGNTTTRRYAVSYDGNASKAPTLRVNYTLPTAATCLVASRASTVRAATDDGEDTGPISTASAQKLVASSAALTSATNVGLRFSSLNVPQGAVIRSVTLRLRASNAPTSTATRGTFTVRGSKEPNIATFAATNRIFSILSKSTTATVTLTPAATWTVGTANDFTENFTGTGRSTTGLTGIVQEIVDQATWAKGAAFALALKGSITPGSSGCGDNKFPCLYQADQGAYSAASINISYESSDPDDGIRTVRQDLQDLVATMMGTYYGGGTPMAESLYEAGRYMLGKTADYGKASTFPDAASSQNGAGTYVSPIDGGECQSNNIVFLSDGAPSNDDDDKTVGLSCSDSWTCMRSTATFMKSTGFTHDSKKSYINTYTIGFGPEVITPTSAAYVGMSSVASAGGGQFFPATDVDSLVTSFETIFSRLTDTNSTMASPGVAVNQLNRSQHLDQLYYGVFKPKTTKRWPGNLKRYRLETSTVEVVDYRDAPAINDSTTYFSANAVSWWGNPALRVDGNDATKGGAAERQTGPIPIYTDDPTSNVMSLLNAASPPAALGSGDNVKWLQGYDVDNDNGQGASGFRQGMGAPMHAQPVMIAYGSGNDYVVFVGTNDGLLHSINAADGTQNWAWLPSDLQANVAALREDAAMGSGGSPLYGLDGSFSVVSQGSTRLLVGGMRQGGSNYYALKLPSSKTAAPVLEWVIRPTTSTAFSRLGKTWSQPQQINVRIGGVATPVLVFGGGLDDAKYNSDADAKAGVGGDYGNAVYMVNALTGNLIWWGSSSATTSSSATAVTALKYSVPGGIRAVDKNLDGYADHLYFGDVGGQVFRVDMDNTSSAPRLVKRVALLAQLGGAESPTTKADDRRFYEAPALAIATDKDNKLYVAVTIGSGDRNFPKTNKTTEERFYMIRDYDAGRFDILVNQNTADASRPWIDAAGRGYNGIADLATRLTPLQTTDLANLSSSFGATATAAAAAKKGWYLNMPDLGEKVLSSPFIFSRLTTAGTLEYEVNFNSFAPDSNASSGCTPVAGATSVWKVLLSNAGPVSALSDGTTSDVSGDGADRNGDGVIDGKDRKEEGVVSGITGSGVPVIIAKPGGGSQLGNLNGTKGTAGGDPPEGFGHIQRTRWYDKRAN